ncbi:DUF2505 domain-containing protein [Pseudonocardia kujensis]|uniref:DUF2505 domain-containing protein n=1 Tax=Pseudonocardia kujensis TaxID=1128675 RepID=UPI001E3CD6C4|nr:DUF2505 domain-containing protein [Pseudonocardia kujensis]MCE0768273.1 DUF2505 domain-containing protein [Pseudonocardia kujensis]
MPTPLRLGRTFPLPPRDAVARLLDRDLYADRLAAVGGPGALLCAFERDEERLRVVLQQGVPAGALPASVRRFLAGALVLEREERWRVADDRADGEFTLTAAGAPAGATGAMTIGADPVGSALRIDGEVEVRVPLLGAALEAVVADRALVLMTEEMRWTAERLGG